MMNAKEASKWVPRRPNVLITGTPGTGKSTVASEIALELGLRHVDVGQFARERDLVEMYDNKLDCHVLHEDAVLDALEPIMTDGAVILDHHSSDWFPERWIQAVVILRTDTAVLYDRLEAREYSATKLGHNVQAEIMQVVRDEAVASYPRAERLEVINNKWEDKDNIVVQVKRIHNKLIHGSQPT